MDPTATITATTDLTAWQILRLHWPIGLIALAVCLVATPLCRRCAMIRGIVDRPDDFLKPHGRPTAYLGGVAVFAGWMAGLLVAPYWIGIDVPPRLVLAIGGAGLAIMLVGLFDDLHFMPPKIKLTANIAVALWLVAFGIGVDLIQVATGPILGTEGLGQRWLELAYSVPLMVLIVIVACNATNLLDGMDGLCSGVLAIASIGLLILAVHLRTAPAVDVGIANLRIVLALAMLGATAGFLPFNRHPATIFLGDAGSMLLGLNAAILILLLAEEQAVRWVLAAGMVFGLPLSDMILTLMRRWRNGRPLMQGDRSHFYDQLHDRGLSVWQVVTISYMLALGFALVGVSALFLTTRYFVIVCCLAAGAVVFGIWTMDMVGIVPESRSVGKDSQPKPLLDNESP
jgi:UDP-GlcNAc:undecaprenyl-phosphate/decaprenyl-phosphate GlcNAc-1-phosphate transferase